MFPALGREVEIKAPVVSKSAEEATPRAARMATGSAWALSKPAGAA
jgi:hypothetical protein